MRRRGKNAWEQDVGTWSKKLQVVRVRGRDREVLESCSLLHSYDVPCYECLCFASPVKCEKEDDEFASPRLNRGCDLILKRHLGHILMTVTTTASASASGVEAPMSMLDIDET